KIEEDRAAKIETLQNFGTQGVMGEEKNILETEATSDEGVMLPQGQLNEAGDFEYDLGEVSPLEMKDGYSIEVGVHAAERKLINFITDDSKLVDKETWFTLDRLSFETGSAVLKASSMEQVKNIAGILKTYP